MKKYYFQAENWQKGRKGVFDEKWACNLCKSVVSYITSLVHSTHDESEKHKVEERQRLAAAKRPAETTLKKLQKKCLTQYRFGGIIKRSPVNGWATQDLEN